ncbi:MULTISPECIES: aldo/keto reductase [Rhodopseudomonas]|uniref:Oxidoreductase n=1 Tax=Rhodopseudomonas palustris TaxID=1076 RepID=A0A0D7F3E7_RHOPL|nr:MULTISPECIES: aldo/keto reductase [Rhodopseudomonas]KIZ47633.1 oxidoreductase [Rhodopseudomonas palustris]MDF3811214.1 aldo/keto reductase [Rhodopseudomonas sp. BAL398]WOK19538.1 aldo/keto reductase [Rhodopseudomonas sp. BAL398]
MSELRGYAASQPRLFLNDRKAIPQIGLGVWQTPPEVAGPSVETALRAGYCHIDTAAIYRNEVGVGEGIRAAGIGRKNLFITTKLWNEDQGYDATLRAFDESLERLGLDYVDLYLIHWPSPQRGLYVDTWKAFIRLQEQGLVRSIGVSNFEAEHLNKIISATGVAPVLNQVELHPRFQQRKLRDVHEKLGIATQSWSPLGQGTLLGHPVINSIAERHQRTPAQIIIRWHIDNGLVVIPKSVTPSRIVENFDVFGFGLDEAELVAIGKLNATDGRIGPNPLTATF